MAVVDVNAWVGSWPSQSINAGAAEVRGMLKSVGVERIFMAPLDAAWAQNPHLPNDLVYDAAQRWADVHPVPIIDPTIATWKGEVDRAQRHSGVRLVKWLPAYAGYELAAADECAQALVEADLSLMVQTRIEDPRSRLICRTSLAAPERPASTRSGPRRPRPGRFRPRPSPYGTDRRDRWRSVVGDCQLCGYMQRAEKLIFRCLAGRWHG